jgi:hypothetical protein
MGDAVERLMAELVDASIGATRSKRARIAVTVTEYLAVRQYLLEHDGRFYGRIRNIPLVVDEHAAKPRFVIEHAAAPVVERAEAPV